MLDLHGLGLRFVEGLLIGQRLCRRDILLFLAMQEVIDTNGRHFSQGYGCKKVSQARYIIAFKEFLLVGLLSQLFEAIAIFLELFFHHGLATFTITIAIK